MKFNQENQASRSTGLGLFITREIIRKHGGSIRAESEEGNWIKFMVTLPETVSLNRESIPGRLVSSS